MTKTFIWLGLFVGSTLGGLVPLLWGGSMFSATSMLLSMVGAIAGIFAGYKIAQSMG